MRGKSEMGGEHLVALWQVIPLDLSHGLRRNDQRSSLLGTSEQARLVSLIRGIAKTAPNHEIVATGV